MRQEKSILIVEDETVLQDVYELILKKEGYVVYTASNGVEGLQQIKSHKPDLVLLDLFMPVMGGKELMRNIDLKQYPRMKIIVYSNLSDRATESEMLDLGAHEFILKASMTPNDLVSVVERHLSWH